MTSHWVRWRLKSPASPLFTQAFILWRHHAKMIDSTLSRPILLYLYFILLTLQMDILLLTWWRHQMEIFSALLAICARNSPVPGEFPTQRPVTRSLIFSLICVWINVWVNNREAGDLRRYHAHYDVIVMQAMRRELETLMDKDTQIKLNHPADYTQT